MNRILFYWLAFVFFIVLLSAIGVSVYRSVVQATDHFEEKLNEK